MKKRKKKGKKMKKKIKKFNINFFWLKIVIMLFSFIFISMGFIFGYSYGDKSCFENPLAYGIKEINDYNRNEFQCSCASLPSTLTKRKQVFSFNESGFYNNH